MRLGLSHAISVAASSSSSRSSERGECMDRSSGSVCSGGIRKPLEELEKSLLPPAERFRGANCGCGVGAGCWWVWECEREDKETIPKEIERENSPQRTAWASLAAAESVGAVAVAVVAAAVDVDAAAEAPSLVDDHSARRAWDSTRAWAVRCCYET